MSGYGVYTYLGELPSIRISAMPEKSKFLIVFVRWAQGLVTTYLSSENFDLPYTDIYIIV